MEQPQLKQKRVPIKRVKGTQDILDVTMLNYLKKTAFEHFATYNFQHIITPILEPLELFQRTLGNQTDVVSKEMYTVQPSSDKNPICLRPEVTASVMRAFIEHAITLTPWKVYTFGPMFRHERPQKGRYREFYQISIEAIGVAAIRYDAHFIKMLDRLFSEKFPLDNYALLINFLGCEADRAQFKQALHSFLSTIPDELCATCLERQTKNILRIFDCKKESCKLAYKQAPAMTHYLCKTCDDEWGILKEELEHLSVSYSVDPKLVRGLDYYAKTVFEFVGLTELGAQNSFCGGGRYNKLATYLGAHKDYPSIGAGIGVERLSLLLESQRKGLPVTVEHPLFVIIPLTQEQHSLSLLIADELQAHNMRVDIILEDASIKSLMRKADKLYAQFVVMIGPDEQAAREVTLKNMETGQAQRINQAQLVNAICHISEL